jgi:pyruvate-formate lyase-activating enzyme
MIGPGSRIVPRRPSVGVGLRPAACLATASRPSGGLNSFASGGPISCVSVERISIEVTNRCSKACPFCYNQSNPDGRTCWDRDRLIGLVEDCAAHGVKAVSFGGGEPLEYEGICDVLTALTGKLFRSVTTNGLPLCGEAMTRLLEARPDKVHISLHFPGCQAEVSRVIRQAQELAAGGIRSGINLLVSRSGADAAERAAEHIRAKGIGHDRLVFLPMRGCNTPTPAQIAAVGRGQPFQSTSCLARCGPSPRFCSISWNGAAAWCSYTTERKQLAELTYRGLTDALDGLGVVPCGGTT